VVAGVGDTAHLYAFGAVDTEVNIVHADRSTPGFMRSPPMVPYMYALETAMDELAVKLGMDPIELRRVNDTMTEPIEGKPFSSRSLMKCYDRAADSFGLPRLPINVREFLGSLSHKRKVHSLISYRNLKRMPRTRKAHLFIGISEGG
jgi:CO/xanthine dehydrogenase Mo-binding subunit